MSSVTLLVIKGAISELTEEEQAKVYVCALEIKGSILKNGDRGLLALALVGAELEEQV